MAAISLIAGDTGHQHNWLARKRHRTSSHGRSRNASPQQAPRTNAQKQAKARIRTRFCVTTYTWSR